MRIMKRTMRIIEHLWMELSEIKRFSFIDVIRIFIIVEIIKYFI
jgi:hypothetical protein